MHNDNYGPKYPIEVINIKHIDRVPVGSMMFRIGRGTSLGNPFVMDSEEDRAHVIEMYRKWIWRQMSGPGWNGQKAALRAIMDAQDEGHRVVLACFCKPKPCHGDVIVAAIDWLRGKPEAAALTQRWRTPPTGAGSGAAE